MKQKLQLQIPEPCHEDWNKMSETQQGRFCMSCCKEVVDFSVMSDKEILNYISTASSNICGRVAGEQLNRDLIAPREPNKIGWRYWVSVAASFLLITSKADAQIKVPENATVHQTPLIKGDTLVNIRVGGVKTIRKNASIKMQLHGIVIDENNNPIPYATIKLVDSNEGVAANDSGQFTLNGKSTLLNLKLVISSVGFETKDIDISNVENVKSISVIKDAVKIEIGNITLNRHSLKEVIVTGGTIKGRMSTGLMAICTKVTIYEKIKDALGVNEIKVYPNPIAQHSIFNIKFAVKDQGEYNLQFTDASGRIVSSQPLLISEKNQLRSFNAGMFSSSGIYFVSLYSKQNAKIYTSKFLVQ